ncbi:hypothetical protein LIER_14760 [Lithospermum erythrorhizon]|uniref:Uncharacterized protein n=1 Tax=Lithospermum erythrorhizon TaxID=34254 RepID=A0AAV3Q0A4_LITER
MLKRTFMNISEMHIADETEETPLVADGTATTDLVQEGENITMMPVAGGTRPIAEGENNCSRKLSKRQRSDHQIQVGLDVLKLELKICTILSLCPIFLML